MNRSLCCFAVNTLLYKTDLYESWNAWKLDIYISFKNISKKKPILYFLKNPSGKKELYWDRGNNLVIVKSYAWQSNILKRHEITDKKD